MQSSWKRIEKVIAYALSPDAFCSTSYGDDFLENGESSTLIDLLFGLNKYTFPTTLFGIIQQFQVNLFNNIQSHQHLSEQQKYYLKTQFDLYRLGSFCVPSISIQSELDHFFDINSFLVDSISTTEIFKNIGYLNSLFCPSIINKQQPIISTLRKYVYCFYVLPPKDFLVLHCAGNNIHPGSIPTSLSVPTNITVQRTKLPKIFVSFGELYSSFTFEKQFGLFVCRFDDTTCVLVFATSIWKDCKTVLSDKLATFSPTIINHILEYFCDY